MSSDAIISVESLGKKYRIRHQQAERYTALRDVIAQKCAAPFRALFRRNGSREAQNPKSEPGEVTNPFSTQNPQPSSEDFWALKDVSFEVKRGEVVGIIGRNGAGKSTLLKILSRITEPTEGRVRLRGRVASLLEVGTGFHPELTGRENIFLNGAILGMARDEIVRKFDEIIAFAEVEKFLDTPVKRYSSGMYVRLAFAVAAHLEPEILVVDEVLAVGDAEFQKKCMGKMKDVAANSGRTVLFVSHNMGAVLRLCGRCLWLDQGELRMAGGTSETIAAYLQHGASTQAERYWSVKEAPGDDSIRLRAVRICQPARSPTSVVDLTKPFDIEIETEVIKPTSDVVVALRVLTPDGQTVLHTADITNPQISRKQLGPRVLVCQVPAHILNMGTYVLTVGADVPNARMIFIADGVLTWTVEPVALKTGAYRPDAWKGVSSPEIAHWSVRDSELQP